MSPVYAVAAALALAAFNASAQNAPPCTDKAATETVRELFWGKKLSLKTIPTAADGNAWRAYNDFPVVDVVSNGYDTGLRKRSCSASLGKGRNPIRVHYTLQVTESDPGRFMVGADFSSMPERETMALRELIVQAINTPAR